MFLLRRLVTRCRPLPQLTQIVWRYHLRNEIPSTFTVSSLDSRRILTCRRSYATSSLGLDEYHQQSDKYIDSLVAQLEEIAEDQPEIDVEYSAGVLTIKLPAQGTYVINKQPPNRQIWISSPLSGPKRYDWVPSSHGHGQWIYLRDGSSLDDLLRSEMRVNMRDI